jgi:hypothetical protein
MEKVQIVYCYIIFGTREVKREEHKDIFWLVIKTMLDEFPKPREKALEYLRTQSKIDSFTATPRCPKSG